MSALTNFIETVQEQDNPDAITHTLDTYLHSTGFTGFVYHVFRAPERRPAPKTVWTYPDSWMDYYDDLSYQHTDLALITASSTILPYRWDDVLTRQKAGKRERRVFQEARDFGILNGASIPIHGPENDLTVLSLATDQPTFEFNKIWKARRNELPLIGAYTHEAMLRCATCGSDYKSIRLTGRERECLAWTAKGKTCWEVSEILHISNETVRTHLRSAMQKLDVYSKHHAVVKAVILGLVKP